MKKMNISELPLTYSGRVQSENLDSLGHMNVMWYAHFFDRATWAFYETIGFGKEYHHGTNGSFALEAHSQFLNELRLGEKFSIYTRALARRDKVFHLMHFMQRDSDHSLAATIEALGIHIDMTKRKSVSMPDSIAKAWEHVIAEHAALDWEAPISGSLKA